MGSNVHAFWPWLVEEFLRKLGRFKSGLTCMADGLRAAIKLGFIIVSEDALEVGLI